MKSPRLPRKTRSKGSSDSPPDGAVALAKALVDEARLRVRPEVRFFGQPEGGALEIGVPVRVGVEAGVRIDQTVALDRLVESRRQPAQARLGQLDEAGGIGLVLVFAVGDEPDLEHAPAAEHES